MEVDQDFIDSMEPYRKAKEGQSFFEACRDNVVVFADKMLGIRLYAWQVYFLMKVQDAIHKNIDTREFAAITSRQIGKSTAVAILSLWASIFNKYPGTTGNNTLTLVVSAGDVQAKKLLNEMKKLLRLGNMFMYDEYKDGNGDPRFGKDFLSGLLDDKEANNTTTTSFMPWDQGKHGPILLAGSKAGSTIKSYPPTAIVLGECLEPNSLVYMADGTRKRAKDIKEGDLVLSSDHYKSTASKVIRSFNNGKKEVFEIETSRGKILRNTGNHPIMTPRGWVQTKELTTDDRVAGIIKVPTNTIKSPYTEDELKFVGYMLGDGSCNTRKNLRFTQLPGKQKDEFSAICNNLGFTCSWHKSKGKVYDAHISVKAWDLLRRAGISGTLSGTKTLIKGWERLPLSKLAILLNRYFSCDGWVTKSKHRTKKAYRIELGLYTKSEILGRDVQFALLKFGIKSNIRKRIKQTEDKIFAGYEIAIRSKLGIASFIKEIGIYGKTDTFDLSLLDGVTQSTTHELRDFEFEQIRRIESIGIRDTIGITVENTQCHVVDGILSHNTASIIIEDEAGKTDRITDEFHSEYLYPTGNSTNAVRIYTSTPWVSSGFFYRIVDPDNIYPEQDVVVVVFTIEAIKLENPDYYEVVMKDIRKREADGDIDGVRRAYYCQFVKNSQSYFNSTKVFDCFDQDYDMVESSQLKCDIGVDFGGKTTSRSVITVTTLDEESGEIRRLYKKVYNVQEDDDLMADLEFDVMKRFPNWDRIIPDECPQGDYLIRQMIDKGWNTHPMGFRTDKVKKYGAFRALLNRNRVKSFTDSDLQTEMLAMELSQTSKQSVIQHAPGYSDDEIDSFIMSAYFYLEIDDGIQVFEL